MKTFLIVNADDFGLVPSVSEGILEAHDKGVVSSTTALVTRPLTKSLIQKAKQRGDLGIGIHLNMTLGEPLSRPKRVASLLNEEGRFSKLTPASLQKIKASELAEEWSLQIVKFQKLWGKYPTHLDSHHHIHAFPKIEKVFLTLAKKYKISFRPSSPNFSKKIRAQLQEKGVLLPQTFYGNLDAKKHWTVQSLVRAIESIPPGLHELMCHPGKNSSQLEKISSFQDGREVELRALTSPKVLEIVRNREIQLINFGYLS